jgi:hypothetical protein
MNDQPTSDRPTSGQPTSEPRPKRWAHSSREKRAADFPPEQWTPTNHPYFGRRSEIARLDRSGVATVDQRIAAGHYRARKLGDLVLIEVASVFEYIENAPLHKPRLNPPRAPVPALAPRRRGRPPKYPRADA